MHRFAALLLVLVTALPSSAAIPIPPADDNGDQSFFRQIVPKLLGRRPKGTLEVGLLADLAELVGREAVVRALMEQPEFVDHWTTVLIDQLKVDREGGLAQAESCYGGPMPSGGLPLVEGISPQTTASFVGSASLQSSYHREFNMYELIQDAIREDHVFPIYRAHLFALGHKVRPGNSMISDADQRAIVGSTFDDVFLNRDFECMSCHNSQSAVTDYDGRHHPAYRGLDPVVFADENEPPANVSLDLYQTACASCHQPNGAGIPGSYPNVRDKTAQDIQDAIDVPGSTMNGLGLALDGEDLAALEEALAYGGPFAPSEIATTAARHFGMFRRDFFRPENRYCDDGATTCSGNDDCEDVGSGECQPEEVGWGPWGISTDCAAIWNVDYEGEIPAFFAGLATDAGSVADIDDSLRSGYEALPSASEITGDTAFAYMVAAKITENVWQELMGEPLTLVNRYARNADQKETHKYLTEDVFIEHDWSLEELIVAIVGSGYFNRSAPRDSTAFRDYALAPMWDPFVPATEVCEARRQEQTIGGYVFRDASGGSGDAGSTGAGDFDLVSNDRCAYNGQGDLVHRYSPRTLMNASASALDWSRPRIFPGGSDDPERDFQRSIGQYLSSIDPGTRKIDFQALLYWDDAYGHCGGSGDPESPSNTSDWIDGMLSAIDDENAASPDDPVLLGDAVMTLKDWILQEPTIGGSTCSGELVAADAFVFGDAPEPELSPTEAQALESLFDQPLDSPVDTNAEFEFRVRELCGAYLRSPQFMLAGIVRPDDFPSPRVRTCNAGPCSYVEMCRVYAETLDAMGFELECTTTGVREPLDFTIRVGGEPPPEEDDLTFTSVLDQRDPDGGGDCRVVPEPGVWSAAPIALAWLLWLVGASRMRARGRHPHDGRMASSG